MTSNEINPRTDEMALLPPQRDAQPAAIAMLEQHAQSMDATWQLAQRMCASSFVPQQFRGKPEDGFAAMMYGAELGLNPIQSLQNVFVVHGSPAIYARTAVALAKSKGVVVETVSESAESVTVRGTDTRTGQTEEATWDIARAKKAGFTSNKKYDTEPQAMLYAKAAMQVVRRIAPDVLLGIPYSAEELELSRPARVTSERVAANPKLTALAGGKPEPTVDRDSLDKTMFTLLKDANVNSKDDGLAVLGWIAGREITASAELSDDEVQRVIDALTTWAEDDTTEAHVTDIINTALLAASDE